MDSFACSHSFTDLGSVLPLHSQVFVQKGAKSCQDSEALEELSYGELPGG